MRIKYVGSFDEVEIPAAGLVVKRGESIEVTDEVGKTLLVQPENFAPADDASVAFNASLPAEGLDKLTIPLLKDHAEAHGIDVGKATKKADLIAAIREHNEQEGS